MREFYFYGSWEDSFAILEAILGTGKALAFYDRPYPEPKARFFDKLTPELREIAGTHGGFGLWLPGISDPVPLRFARWDSGVFAGQYFVTGDGPYLNLSLPGCYAQGPEGSRSAAGANGLLKLAAGCLSCAHEFYLPEPGIVVKMPRAAQEVNDELVKIIKAHCKRFGPKKRWVGHHARMLLEDGKAEVVSPGYYK